MSPCVLPIVPGYLSFISGINPAEFRGGQPVGDQRFLAAFSRMCRHMRIVEYLAGGLMIAFDCFVRKRKKA